MSYFHIVVVCRLSVPVFPVEGLLGLFGQGGEEVGGHAAAGCDEGFDAVDADGVVARPEGLPVVLHNEVNDSFSDLPILILDKWSDFESKKEEFLERIEKNKDFSLEKLSKEYWRNMIYGTTR